MEFQDVLRRAHEGAREMTRLCCPLLLLLLLGISPRPIRVRKLSGTLAIVDRRTPSIQASHHHSTPRHATHLAQPYPPTRWIQVESKAQLPTVPFMCTRGPTHAIPKLCIQPSPIPRPSKDKETLTSLPAQTILQNPHSLTPFHPPS